MNTFKILQDYFQNREEIAFAFLFGSRSKALDRTKSDFDIGIYFQPENPREIEFEEIQHYPSTEKIWADLELLLKQEVDLVVLNRTSASMAAEVITKGTPIIIKNRDVFLKFLLVVTSWAIDHREFVKDYYEISQRSKSLSEEDKKNLRRIIIFLENEIEDYKWARKVSWLEYQGDRHKRRDLERWIENIMNSVIDVSKILLSSKEIALPETYRETILNLKLLRVFNDLDIDRVSQWTKLRNILAHQYLDIKWEQIQIFVNESGIIIENFIEKTKGFL